MQAICGCLLWLTVVVFGRIIGLKFYKFDSNTNSIYLAENQTVRPTSKPFPASEAFDNFMNSSPHKSNMLSSIHKYVGVGYIIAKEKALSGYSYLAERNK